MECRALLPVTVKMVNESATGELSPYGRLLFPTTTVRVVGRCITTGRTDDSVNFTIYDGTGMVRASYWFETTSVWKEQTKVDGEGQYLDVVGRVIMKDNGVFLQAFSCRVIRNFNDITHHFLHAIHTYIELNRMELPKPSEQCVRATEGQSFGAAAVPSVIEGDFSGKVKSVDGINVCHELGHSCLQKIHNGSELNNEGVVKDVENYDELKYCSEEEVLVNCTQEFDHTKELRTRVLETIRANVADLEGVSVGNLSIELDIEETCLRSVLCLLESVGEIYQTIDGDHYAAT